MSLTYFLNGLKQVLKLMLIYGRGKTTMSDTNETHGVIKPENSNERPVYGRGKAASEALVSAVSASTRGAAASLTPSPASIDGGGDGGVFGAPQA